MRITSPIECAPLRVSGSAPVELEQAPQALIADDLAIRSSSGLDQFVAEALVIVLRVVVRELFLGGGAGAQPRAGGTPRLR